MTSDRGVQGNWTRSEGDSWDIVSSVGITALAVAAARAVESGLPDALVHDPYAEHFVRAAGEPSLIALLENPSLESDNPARALRQIGLRSKFFDAFFLSAAEAGCTQAVILAAGLDVRAHRLAWPEGTKVFEIDQPKVLEFKDRVLQEQGAVPTSDRREVAVDLRDDWPKALRDAGFDPEIPTAWSAEGLLVYLPAAAQDSLFERVVELSAPRSRISIQATRGRPDMAKWSEMQKKYSGDNHPMSKIDFAGLFYDEDRTDADEWFAARGWVIENSNTLDLANAYGIEVPDLPEELTDLAEKALFTRAVLPEA